MGVFVWGAHSLGVAIVGVGWMIGVGPLDLDASFELVARGAKEDVGEKVHEEGQVKALVPRRGSQVAVMLGPPLEGCVLLSLGPERSPWPGRLLPWTG